VTQNFQFTSSSEPHAGQRWIARFCPQLGQKITRRPAGSAPPQKRQSPAGGEAVTGVLGREAGGDGMGARMGPDERAPGGGGGTFGELARGGGGGGGGDGRGGTAAPLARGCGLLSIGPPCASARRTASATSTTRDAANSR
jgi:hypothetical protein